MSFEPIRRTYDIDGPSAELLPFVTDTRVNGVGTFSVNYPALAAALTGTDASEWKLVDGRAERDYADWYRHEGLNLGLDVERNHHHYIDIFIGELAIETLQELAAMDARRAELVAERNTLAGQAGADGRIWAIENELDSMNARRDQLGI